MGKVQVYKILMVFYLNASQNPAASSRIPNTTLKSPRADYEKLSGDRVGETSEAIRARVQAARDIQNKRFSSNQRLPG
jgi:hypothetical protein